MFSKIIRYGQLAVSSVQAIGNSALNAAASGTNSVLGTLGTQGDQIETQFKTDVVALKDEVVSTVKDGWEQASNLLTPAPAPKPQAPAAGPNRPQ